jgi:hypothetical protein
MGQFRIGTDFDLFALGLLPSYWIEDILKLAEDHAVFVHLDGSTDTSFEPDDTEGTNYEVVPGDVLRDGLDWLYKLYTGELLHLASRASGIDLAPAESLRYGVNINKLTGPGARYEWHVDSNPVTGVLFVTSHPPDEGGELLLRHGGEEEVRISPVSGHFFVFPAAEVPHAVAPMKGATVRITVPMSYFRNGEAQILDLALEEYLFGTVHQRSS